MQFRESCKIFFKIFIFFFYKILEIYFQIITRSIQCFVAKVASNSNRVTMRFENLENSELSGKMTSVQKDKDNYNFFLKLKRVRDFFVKCAIMCQDSPEFQDLSAKNVLLFHQLIIIILLIV